MSNVFLQAIRHRFETSVSMPREAIEACPDDLWDESDCRHAVPARRLPGAVLYGRASVQVAG